MLSANRKYEQSVTTDERRKFTEVLGADKEKVHHDQTLGNTGGNNNKDAMLDWRSGCQSEDKCNCHIHMTTIISISFVAFVCILYQVIFACCAEMFVWL